MKDFKDRDLAVGDTIVYAFAAGTTPYLRIGVIKEFLSKKATYGNRWVDKMRVEWTETERVYDHSTQIWSVQPKVWTSLVENPQRALKI